MEEQKYPITFLDYTIIVPIAGIILFDEEMKPENLCVKDGDTFEVKIINGRITFYGLSRKK